jgi:hypothetical protein
VSASAITGISTESQIRRTRSRISPKESAPTSGAPSADIETPEPVT